MSTLSPLDLLSLSDSEQLIVQCLSKRPKLTIPEILEATRLPADELKAVIQEMVRSGRLVEQLKGGQRTFAVRFSRDKKRVRNMLPGMLDIFEQTADSFLATAPLTKRLDEAGRAALLQGSITRTLLPEEVCVWQSNGFEYVGLVRFGLLKKSRIHGQQVLESTTGYLRGTEWFGLSEALSRSLSTDTYTAITETEVLLWPVDTFLDLVQRDANLSLEISRWVSHQLHECRGRLVQGMGKLWVIEGAHRQAGATTLATNLALLAARNGIEPDTRHQPRVALWNVHGTGREMQQMLGMDLGIPTLGAPTAPTAVRRHESGVELIPTTERGDFPAQVQLDIALTALQGEYDYIICDTGAELSDEFTLRLRGRADTLITLTADRDGAAEALERWTTLKAYARPAQKRMLALNRSSATIKDVNPAFHLALPEDATPFQSAQGARQPVVMAAPDSSIAQAIREVYRRLSLTHAVGIFIPSTVDVDQAVDNSTQVQAALAFLGNVFGGATRNEAEGVWRSEDSGLVIEQVVVVRSFVSEKALERHLDEVITFASRLKEEMKQEAIALDVDNQLILV